MNSVKMKNSPAFQFYPADFLVGTAEMSAEEVGGYIRLLCYQWTKGELPNNDKKLMQLSFVFDQEALKTIKSKFEVRKNGTIVNLKLEKVRIEQDEYREKQRIKALKKWESKTDAVALPLDESGICQTDALQSSPSNSNLNTTSLPSNNLVVADSNESTPNNSKFDFKKELISIGVDKSVATDWMEVRRKKKASNTETAFKQLVKEINASGRSPNECITEAVARSWQGFKAEWLNNIKTQQNGTTTNTKFTGQTATDKRLAAEERLRKRLEEQYGIDGMQTNGEGSAIDVEFQSVD